jgi:NADP-dependent alcohol dehydrogenase
MITTARVGSIDGTVWAPASRVSIGAGSAEELAAHHGQRGRVALIVDANLAAEVTAALRRALGVRGRWWALTPELIDVTLLEATATTIAAELGEVDAILAVGGGSVLDAAAVLRVMLAGGRPRVPPALTLGRSGLVVLPAVEPMPRLLAVPTTVGTAAEVSRAATLLLAGRRRLLNAAHLAADEVALDPGMTRTLPPGLLRTGITEAILRTINLLIAPPGRGWYPAADEEAHCLLTALARRGTVACGAHDDELRLDVAVLSVRTVLGSWVTGRHPFVGRTWFCANELASVAGVSKMAATLVMAPLVWTRVLAGDTRFGRSDRLTSAWAAVCRGVPTLPRAPVAGLRYLAALWDLPRMTWPAEVGAGELALRTLRFWGGGLPMLAGFDRNDLHALFRQAQVSCG